MVTRNIAFTVNKLAPDVTKLVFVDCWAPWCGPCLALSPVLEELDEKYADNTDVAFVKINTQDHRSYAMENNIVAIPCVLLFFNGAPAKLEIPDSSGGPSKIIDRLVGLRPAEHYEAVIETLL